MHGVGTPGRHLDRPLIGRDPDLALLRDFVDEATAVGGALLVSGEAGVGKTVLLEAAAAHATQHGMRVLWAAGAQFEADVSFAGLNQLVQPPLPDLAGLSPVHRRALGIALGLDAGPASGQLLVSNAALAFLEQATSVGPVLVVVDDVQWMDRASARVLGFVARRVVGHQVGFLAAARTGEETFFEPNGVAGHLLGPLDDAASASLLDDRYPAMAPRTRRRLQDEARGNPLALLELPAALEAPYRDLAGSLPTVLPLTERLQSVFAARVRSLPGATQDALLLAALEGTGDLSLLQSVLPGSGALDALAPSEKAAWSRSTSVPVAFPSGTRSPGRPWWISPPLGFGAGCIVRSPKHSGTSRRVGCGTWPKPRRDPTRRLPLCCSRWHTTTCGAATPSVPSASSSAPLT